ncbi:Xanthine dehydrogenase [Hypsibius exemplaris]|uniref:Xanthine dehydrogenase n=1 Tax=Hypsibius exemplaris TaxID=2072580 RepID=A0A1W0X6H0_HYPEX|nr:Xanthine dehydrogenase [Hypsibius exemplaris]
MTPPFKSSSVGAADHITVTINGVKYDVPTTFSEVSLNQYLREHLYLTGTKVTCREGGCGVCTVHVAYPDPTPDSKTIIQRSINSCLCPILSCDKWEITTVEGVGNQNNPHPIQTAMTDHYGTQCGYCTPGWVMSMYSTLKNNTEGTLTRQDVENACDGNICRCTGYRPILDAFKTFAIDQPTTHSTPDIEDVKGGVCKKTGKSCAGNCHAKVGPFVAPFVAPLSAAAESVAPPWYKPSNLSELFSQIQTLGTKNVYFVVGHTGKGVYDEAPYDAYVDLKGVGELYGIKTPSADLLTIGANTSLTDLIAAFKNQSKLAGFQHLESLAALISKTAHHSVRNIGSWGGNMAMKNRHKEFPSDSFIAFAVGKANIVVGSGPDMAKSYTTEQFLDLDMKGQVILRAEFPSFPEEHVFRTFKVMPRSGNAHAYVNSGFRAQVDKKSQPGQVIIKDVALVFGNISPNFIHARATEVHLQGANIADPPVLQQALTKLKEEVVPTEDDPCEASAAYKKSLSMSLFYKFALELVGDLADTRYRSAVGSLVRPLSSGKQTYSTVPDNYPVTRAMPKLESMVQCTGEAKYVSDVQQGHMLHAAFTLTTLGNAAIYKVDPTDAKAFPGVTMVILHGDIPGINNVSALHNPEELLASKRSLHAGQPIAIVVAVSQDVAEKAAKLVKVEYFDVQPPILNCRDAIAKQSFHPQPKGIVVGDAAAVIASAAVKVSGEIEMGTQNHFHMETEGAVTYPTEDGLNIESGTQHMDSVQQAVSQCCGIGKHRINVTVKRTGGGFGGKGGKNWIAGASAVAAFLTRRPVKVHVSLWDNLRMKGRRYPYLMKYQAGTDSSGKLLGVIMDIYGDAGASDNYIGPLNGAGRMSDNVYSSTAWKVSLYACKTNTPANTFCRAPGSTEAIYFIEYILEHVAKTLKKPSLDIKRLNFYKNGDTRRDGSIVKDIQVAEITDQLMESAEYTARMAAVTSFNQANRWRKRGMNVVPMRFDCHWAGRHYNCLIAIFHAGGTIAVTHGGIEMGQGINTKVAQVVAFELGVDVKYIVIQPTQTITNANASGSNGSVTSELVCLAAIDCCKQLRTRIDAVRGKDTEKTWEVLIEECFKKGVDLSAHSYVSPVLELPVVYSTYSAMCTEVELDVLTGEYQITRLDMLYDCGESTSPMIDIGQAEGAIVMGLGYFLSENQVYDPKTGENVTFGTWKYKPPMAKDIPIDFRVAFLPNAPNPSGVLRSKLVGEPPLCMTSSVVFALRNAIAANLAEVNKDDVWFHVATPMTVERVQQYNRIEIPQLRYKD